MGKLCTGVGKIVGSQCGTDRGEGFNIDQEQVDARQLSDDSEPALLSLLATDSMIIRISVKKCTIPL